MLFLLNVQVITAQIQITMLILIISRRIYSLVRNSTAHPEQKWLDIYVALEYNICRECIRFVGSNSA
jgi:thiaminase